MAANRSAWTRAVGAVAVLFVVNVVALELLMLTSTLAHWSSDVHTRAEVELGLQRRPKAWAVLVAVAFAVVYGLLIARNPGLRSNLGLHDFLEARLWWLRLSPE